MKTSILDSVLSSYAEIHLLELGVFVGILVIVLRRRGYGHLSALVLTAATLAVFINYGAIGWRSHPWYFLGPLAALVLLDEYVASRRTSTGAAA